MGLMIEKVQQDIGKKLRLWHARCGLVAVEIGQCRIVKVLNNRNQPTVFGHPRPGQSFPVFIQNRIKLIWVVSYTGQSFQPETVGQEKVIKRPM